MIPNIEKFWQLSGKHRSLFTEDENYFFDAIGLILLTNIKNAGYWCTPTNSLTFAETGGDGVHYGFLMNSEGVDENSPVIMTLPCGDNCNIVIAENFIEFLSLGSRSGYFDIEQIEYAPELHFPYLDAHKYSEDASAEDILLLKKIEHEFSLKPLSNHEARLIELKKKYFNRLQYSKEYYEILA